MAALAQGFGNPDREVLVSGTDSYLTGVPLGVDRPLPRTPAVYERKKSWRECEEQQAPPVSKSNYVSCTNNVEVIRQQFEDERAAGFMRTATREELVREYAVHLCVSPRLGPLRRMTLCSASSTSRGIRSACRGGGAE